MTPFSSPFLRRKTPAALVAAALLLVVPGAPAAAQSPDPCSAPGYADFDFWVGTWEVFAPDGHRVGSNTIRKTLAGCVLHERYTTPAGFRGESFSTFDAARRVWHQTWVDATGTLLVLEGGLEGDAMVLRGETVRPDGARVRERITWTPLEGDRVRQHWERTTDGGEGWSTVFDGEYRKVR